MHYDSTSTTKVVVNDKIAAFFQQIYLPSIISDVTNNKVKIKKTEKLLG